MIINTHTRAYAEKLRAIKSDKKLKMLSYS